MQSAHNVLRTAAGTLLAAATLLAGGALSAIPANAADPNYTNIDTIGTDGNITVNKAAPGDTFKAIRVGTYTNALEDAANEKIAALEVGKTGDATADTAVDSAVTKVNGAQPSGTDPITWVSSHWLGYGTISDPVNPERPNTDGSSNNSAGVDRGQPYSGSLRDFVTELQKDSAFTGLAGTTMTATANGVASFSNIPAGMYVIFQTAAGSNANKPNSIPILVGTTLFDSNESTAKELSTFVDSDAPALGTVNAKDGTDANGNGPDITKTSASGETVISGAVVNKNYGFKITGHVPQTTGFQSYVYKISDTPSAALQYVADSTSVTVGANSTELTVCENASATTIGNCQVNVVTSTDSTTGKQTITFLFNVMDSATYHYNDAITINYKMKLLSLDGNPTNSAKLEYSGDPMNQPSTDPNNSCNVLVDPTDSTKPCGTNSSPNVDHKVSFSSYNLVVRNYRKGDTNKTGLKGAQFELGSSNGTPINLTKISDGHYSVANNTATRVDATEAAVDSRGQLKIDGLADGTYKVKQTKSAENMFSSALPTFTLVVDGQAATHFTFTPDFWKLTQAADPFITSDNGDLDHPNNNTANVDVLAVNAISSLPMTGGAGIILFAVLALLLAAIAAGATVLRRRVSVAQVK